MRIFPATFSVPLQIPIVQIFFEKTHTKPASLCEYQFAGMPVLYFQNFLYRPPLYSIAP